MAIANGQVILAADLDALTTAQLAACATDAAQLPLGGEVSFIFSGALLVAPAYNVATWVAPYDCLLEVMAVQSADNTAASTATVSLYAPGILDAFPVTVAGAVGAGITKLTRVLYDNVGLGNARTARVIPKGATVEVRASASAAVAASQMQVVLVFRQFFSRS